MKTYTVDEIMKTIQYLEIEFNKEIESLKKTQSEIKVEMETSRCQTKTSEVILTSEVSLTNSLKDGRKDFSS